MMLLPEMLPTAAQQNYVASAASETNAAEINQKALRNVAEHVARLGLDTSRRKSTIVLTGCNSAVNSKRLGAPGPLLHAVCHI
jgi:hypothetical protein